MPDQSPYFLAVKAAHLVKLVWERERCNLPVSLEDVRMFRIRAHEVATLAELAEQPANEGAGSELPERCPSKGPPPHHFRCGLCEGHGGNHTALIPSSAPWAQEKWR